MQRPAMLSKNHKWERLSFTDGRAWSCRVLTLGLFAPVLRARYARFGLCDLCIQLIDRTRFKRCCVVCLMASLPKSGAVERTYEHIDHAYCDDEMRLARIDPLHIHSRGKYYVASWSELSELTSRPECICEIWDEMVIIIVWLRPSSQRLSFAI